MLVTTQQKYEHVESTLDCRLTKDKLKHNVELPTGR